jgi:hypothetical protein
VEPVVARPGAGSRQARFKNVGINVDRTPTGIDLSVRFGWSHVLREAQLADTVIDEVLLGFDQRHAVRPAGVVRPPELDEVVLPETDWADVIRTRFGEPDMTATRTGAGTGHRLQPVTLTTAAALDSNAHSILFRLIAGHTCS